MMAKDIMTRRVITVSPSATVKDLANILILHRISGAPVADQQGKILGLVSEMDIVAKHGKQVKAIMSKKVVTVAENTPVESIANLMVTHHVKRLPVMKGKNLVGIVSRSDIVKAIASGQYIHLYTPIYDL